MKTTLHLTIAVLLLLLVAACAKPQLTDEPRPSVPSSGADTIVAPTVTSPDDGAASGEQEPSLDAKAALREIYDNPPEEYSVAYDSTLVMNGQKHARSEIVFVKGDRERDDIEYSVNGQLFKRRTITDGEKLIVCSRDSAWECYALDLPENATTKPSFDEVWGDKDVQFAPDRVVVGTVTRCFRAAFTAEGQGTTISEACYDDDNVPLYFELRGPQGQLVQRAVSYGNRVPDSAFEPPATPGTQEEFLAKMNETMQQR